MLRLNLSVSLILSGLSGSVAVVFLMILLEPSRVVSLNTVGFWNPPFFYPFLPFAAVGGFFISLIGLALLPEK